MKVVAEVAHARQAAPAFVLLHDREVRSLRGLPGWMRWLFVELVMLSDFKTGAGRTSWDQLAAVMGCDQPERGPRHPVPSRWQLRNAVDHLELLQLISRDNYSNRLGGVLFFQLNRPRTTSSPAGKLRRELRKGQQGRKPLENRHSGPAEAENSAGNSASGSPGVPPPPASPIQGGGEPAVLPRFSPPPQRLRQLAAELKSRPPKGGKTKPAGAGTPPRRTSTGG